MSQYLEAAIVAFLKSLTDLLTCVKPVIQAAADEAIEDKKHAEPAPFIPKPKDDLPF